MTAHRSVVCLAEKKVLLIAASRDDLRAVSMDGWKVFQRADLTGDWMADWLAAAKDKLMVVPRASLMVHLKVEPRDDLRAVSTDMQKVAKTVDSWAGL